MDISEKTLVLKYLSDENYFWEIKRKKIQINGRWKLNIFYPFHRGGSLCRLHGGQSHLPYRHFLASNNDMNMEFCTLIADLCV